MDMSTLGFYVPICWHCRHWIRGQRCRAFAGDIPIEITGMDFDHRKPHPLDNGLQFEAREDSIPVLDGLFAQFESSLNKYDPLEKLSPRKQ